VAKGWESKSVEGQMEAFASERHASSKQPLTKEQVERQRQREILLLSRTRVLHDLEHTPAPRYRKILEASLAYLNAKLAELGPEV
jgi:hypothetical protein